MNEVEQIKSDFVNSRSESQEANAAEFFLRRRAVKLWDEGATAPAPKPETSVVEKTAIAAAGAAKPSLPEELGEQAIGGIRDTIQEGMEGIDELSTWLKTKYPAYDAIDKAGNKLLFGDERGMIDDNGEPVRFSLPEVEQPSTLAGGITRGVTQFLTGFLPVFRAIKGGEVLSAASNVRRAVAAGAITDFSFFDPNQERLSNLIESNPSLSNPITQYLQANPYDSNIEGRMKNVLEGFGLDTAVSGVFMAALKGYRAMSKTRSVSPDIVDTASEGLQRDTSVAAERVELPAIDKKPSMQFAPPEPPKNHLGDPEQPLVTKMDKLIPSSVTDEQVASMLHIDAPAGNKALNINLSRIRGSEDLKEVLAETADLFKADIQEATRGVQTNEATQQLAGHLGMTVEDLLTRQKGQAFNAEQAVAARNILSASATRLTEMAQQIKGGANSADDMFQFRKMVEMHRAIQLQVSGLTAEAGRALQSFNIQAKSRRQQLRAIDEAIEQYGGRGAVEGIADTLVKLAESGADSATLSQVAGKLSRVTSLDTLLTLRQGALLSSYKTHMINIASNMGTMVSAVPERFLAGAISAARGGDGVAMREGVEMVRGVIGGAWDALNIAGRAFKDNVEFDLATKIPEARLRTITSGNLSQNTLGKSIGLASRALGGKALGEGGMADHLVNGLGWLTDLPFRALGAEDAFFKHLNARMELHALAWRQAESEGLKGKAAAGRAADLVSNPPDEMLDAAIKQARVQTFTNPNRAASAIQTALNQVKVARFVVPFIRTPVNLVKYALDRTPIAPLFADVRADMQAGGARRALAEARIAMGTSVMVAAGSLASAGKITGAPPKDPALRAVWLKENQPYSIKTPDGWLQYNRFDPWGTVLGMGADMWQALAGGDDDTIGQMASMAVIGLSNNVLNKTWMTGLSDFMEAINDPERKGSQYLDYMMASFVPALSRQMNYDLNDPTVRDFDNAWQGMMARIPGYSDSLPAKRDIWGSMRLYNDTSEPDKDPVNELLIRRQIPVSMPARAISVNGHRVRLTAQEYSRYVELARQPAKQTLDQMYDRLEMLEGMGPDSALDEEVKRVLTVHSVRGRKQLLMEFPEILDRAADEVQP